MKKSCLLRLIVFFLSFQVIVNISNSQVIEIDGGVGYSALDMEAWAVVERNDWSNFSGYATAHVLYPLNDILSVGISGGFHHLFWYDFEEYTYHYLKDRNVNAVRLTAFARFNLGQNFIDLGAGPYIFNSFTDFTAIVSIGHSFQLTDKLAIPVKISAAAVFDSDAKVFPITIGAGISYSFR
jgi:hypothetical protein